jgi:CTP-dependent riboflavin kinase
MSYIEQLLLLDRIHYQIEHKSTGPSREFAQRLGISERKLFRILAEMRDMGAVIKYNTDRATFFYMNEVRIDIQIRIDHNNAIRTKGGDFSKNLDLLPFLALRDPIIVLDSY